MTKRKTIQKRQANISGPYRERDAILRELGYATYKAYLLSPLWAAIRGRVLLANPKCFGCGKPAKQVHHTKYTMVVLSGGDDSTLRPVCAGCHKTSEFWYGEKQHLANANDTLKRRHRKLVKKTCWDQFPEYRALFVRLRVAKNNLKGDDRRAAILEIRKEIREFRKRNG